MRLCRHSCASLVLLGGALTAHAQPIDYLSAEAAVSALFPNEKPSEWLRTTGDFNGDGFNDLALIVALFSDSGPMQTRLVVLAGTPGGQYSTLSVSVSVSSKYCEAQKFYNLKSNGANLYVEAMHKADGRGTTSDTLQFRFNRQLGDLELIGRENIWDSFSDESYGRLSVNYQTGTAIEYKRWRGRTKETARSQFAIPQLARLNGFHCDKHFSNITY